MAGGPSEAPLRAIEAGLAAVLRFSRRWRWLVIGGWLGLAALGVLLSIRFLSVDTDSSRMITKRAGFRQAAERFDEAFPRLGDQVVVIVDADTPDAAEAVARALSERLAADEAVRSVFAPALSGFFARNGLLYLDVGELEVLLAQLNDAAPLLERLGPEPSLPLLYGALAEAARQTEPGTPQAETVDRLLGEVAGVVEASAEGEPRYLSWRSLFASGEAPAARQVLTVEPVLDYTRLRPAAGVIEAVNAASEAVLAELSLPAEVSVTGDPVLRSEELQSVSRGIGLAFAASGVMVGVLLFLALRSVTLAAAALGAVLVSICVTAGLAAVTVAPLNLVSVAFTVLMVGLGVDFALHLLLHARAEAGGMGAPFYRTARRVGAALCLTAPTTALAFFAFSPTAFVGMRQLGLVAGVGVLVAFAVCVTLLPAFFATLPPSRPAPAAKPLLSARQLRWAGYGVLALTLPALLLLPRARFDADPMALRDASGPSVVAFASLFEEPETAPLRLDVLASGEEAARARAEALSALPEVRSVRRLQSFVPAEQAAKQDLLSFGALGVQLALEVPPPEAPAADAALRDLRAALQARGGEAADRLGTALDGHASPALSEVLSDTLLRFWPQQRARLAAGLTPDAVTVESLPPEITERFVGEGGALRLEVLPEADLRDEAARRGFVEAVLAVAPEASGGARSTLEAGRIVRNAMLAATGLALLLISALLLAVLRDWRFLALLLVPLLLAALLTTATGVLIGVPYNFANVIVLPLILGIGIDGGIHLAMQRRRGAPSPAHEAVTRRAVVYSALTTIASFGSLAFSPHDGTASMGTLLVVGIGWTLATTLLVLPLLAEWADGRASSRASKRA